MRTLLSMAIVFGTMAVVSSTTEAQIYGDGIYGNGYGFGAGLRQSHGFFGGCCTHREQPPYFAMYPPVYYSGIVRRPYGISPYAAPAGIAPVELSVPQTITIRNPFFENEVAPVSNELEVEPVVDENGNKVTWRPNPYLDTVVDNR